MIAEIMGKWWLHPRKIMILFDMPAISFFFILQLLGYKNLHVLLTFGNAQNPLHLPHQTTSERPKVVRDRKFLTLLTSKCGSRHNGVHFFDMSTSKSGPGMVCFFTFWLGNMLRATTACTFSTSQLLIVVWRWCVLDILTSRRALRYNGVRFSDIATSKSGPKLTCFAHYYFQTCFAPQRRAIFHLSSGQMAPHPPL